VQKLTALIPCRNEEHNIRECLESVKFADEILVVDSFSTDATLEIARRYTDRIVQHEYVNSAAQKNWAIPQASHPWVLIVDADERVTRGLRDEIARILAADGPLDGYWLQRRNVFLGREIRHSGWQGDRVLRLFRRNRGRYEDKHVHASLLLDGRAGACSNPLLHYSYRSLEDELVKIRRYGQWGAADALQAGKQPTARRLFWSPIFTFLYNYIVRGGFLDGRHGLVLCSFLAFGTFYKYAKLWELILSTPGDSPADSAHQ
jgi:glycosyltransferase involved in cell wall biosynthesis